MRHTHPLIALMALSFAAVALFGDTLLLRDGKKIPGTLMGASARHVEFLPNSGKTIKIPIDQIDSVTFSVPPVVAAAPPAPAPAAKPAVILPAGTAFRVRTIDAIDVDATKAGAKFRGAVDDPIMAGGEVIVPRGADVTLVAAKVQQGGKMKGSDLISLKVNSIVVRGRSYPVVTSLSETKSAGEGKKTARKVAGGAGGTVLAASGQPHLKIPSETRLEFLLAADWKVQ